MRYSHHHNDNNNNVQTQKKRTSHTFYVRVYLSPTAPISPLGAVVYPPSHCFITYRPPRCCHSGFQGTFLFLSPLFLN